MTDRRGPIWAPSDSSPKALERNAVDCNGFAIELVLGMIIALRLDRDTPLAKVLRRLIILPLTIAPVLGTLMYKLMMERGRNPHDKRYEERS